MSRLSRRLLLLIVPLSGLLEGCISDNRFGNLKPQRGQDTKSEATHTHLPVTPEEQPTPARVEEQAAALQPLVLVASPPQPQQPIQTADKQPAQPLPTADEHTFQARMQQLLLAPPAKAPAAVKPPTTQWPFFRKVKQVFSLAKGRKKQRQAKGSQQRTWAPARGVKPPKVSLRGGGEGDPQDQAPQKKEKKEVANTVHIQGTREADLKKAAVKKKVNGSATVVHNQELTALRSEGNTGTNLQGAKIQLIAKADTVQQSNVHADKVKMQFKEVNHLTVIRRKSSEKQVAAMDEEKVRGDLQEGYKEKYVHLKNPYGGKQDKPVSIKVATPRLAFQKETKEDKKEQGELTKRHENSKKVKTKITPGELFADREIDGKKQQVNSVVITANAGMGKTAFCQWFAYRWSQEENPTFKDVYVLRVRDLKKEKYDRLQGDPRALAVAIAEQCFPREAHETVSAERVERVYKQLQSGETAVMLDGWDEQQGASESLLSLALARKGNYKLIITSREHGTEQLKQKADLVVEVQEMGDEHVKEYLEGSGLEEEAAKDLVAFLKERPALQELARVPVTLQIIRTLWEEQAEELQKVAVNRTALYKALTEHLWKRYAKKYKRNSQRGKVLQHKARNAAFEALGRVALLGMQRDKFNISKKTLEEALNNVDQNVDMEDVVQHSGLLEEVGDKYEFPHLTFQEYFASKELARMLLDGNKKEKKEARKFLNEHKYEGRFEVMLRFTAGEVYKEQGIKGARKLFKQLDKVQEIGGVQHSLLQMRCLNEWLSMAQDEEDLAELEEAFKEPLEAFNKWLREGLKEVGKCNDTLQNLLTGSLGSLRSVLQHSEFVKIYDKALKSKNKEVRRATAEALGEAVKADPEKVLPLLETAFGDKDEDVRRAAARALGEAIKADPKKALPLLKTALKDKSEWVRKAAARALPAALKAAPDKALPLMETALKDKDYWVRCDASKAFGEVLKANPEKALTWLETALKDEDASVREAAAKVLPEALKTNPDEALTWLETALGDNNEYVHKAALEALGEAVQANPNKALKWLETALGDEDLGVRRAAAYTLPEALKVAPDKVLPWLETALKDKYVRRAAAWALKEAVKVDPDKALKWLETALRDEDVNVRRAAAKALGEAVKVAKKKALPWLKTALEDKYWQVRRAAAWALKEAVKADPEKTFSWLETALKDKYVRCAAAGALPEAVKANPEKALPLLEPGLKDEDSLVRWAALKTLREAVKVDSDTALPFLEKAIKHEDGDVRKAAVKALPEAMKVDSDKAFSLLEAALKSKHGDVREAAALALGEAVKANPNKALPLLETAIKYKDGDVRWAALKTLREAVKADPEKALPLLESALKSKYYNVRDAAVRALGEAMKVAPDKALPLLEKAFENSYRWMIRYTVERALKACPTRLLLAHYLDHSSAKCLGPFIRERLYQEKLVIGPLQKDKHTLTLYPDTGTPQTWQVTKKQAQCLKELMEPESTMQWLVNNVKNLLL